jgi:hypothetical protein
MDFNEFYQAQFTNPKTKSKFTKEADVPLTIPAEQAIRGARSQQKKTLDLKLEPHHIFLAMSNLKKSQFVSIFPNSNNLYDDLIDYYKKNGCISYIKQKQTILEKIRKYIKSNRK